MSCVAVAASVVPFSTSHFHIIAMIMPAPTTLPTEAAATSPEDSSLEDGAPDVSPTPSSMPLLLLALSL